MKTLRDVSEIPGMVKVLLRMDLDVADEDNSRLVKSLNTIEVMLSKQCKVIIVGHKGRPAFAQGYGLASPEDRDKFSLKPVYADLMVLVEERMGTVSGVFIEDLMSLERIDAAVDGNQIVFLENVRFWPGEVENDINLTKYLASLAEIYVQDAFATAHHMSASMNVGTLLPCYFGLSFVEEYKALEKMAIETPHPLVIVLGGVKKDKLDYLPNLLKLADNVLLVGMLPKLVEGVERMEGKEKLIVADLRTDGLDIEEGSTSLMEQVISSAGGVIMAGSVGKWEEESSSMGTQRLLSAMANCLGSKIIAGGDTVAACRKFGTINKMDFISSGGGAMLHMLTKKTLPVVEMTKE